MLQYGTFLQIKTLKEVIQTIKRCEWVTEENLYIEYHDKEWGVQFVILLCKQ